MEIDLSHYDSYDAAYDAFHWDIPNSFNIANAVCGRWATADDAKRRVALFFESDDGTRETYTFWQVHRRANQVANALDTAGITPRTRVGIILPQRPETLFANLGVLRTGAIAVPLSPLYGTEGLRYRLDHSDTEVAIVDRGRAATLADIHPELNALETIITLDDPPGLDGLPWADTIASASPTYDPLPTTPEDSAYIIYTSGTTGRPKGAHHAHRKLLGYIPGWQMINEFPGPDAVHYTPAGWSWVGGLFAVVWCAWYHGHPVVGYDGEFDPETTFRLLESHGITNPLFTSTMLRMLRDVDHSQYDLDVAVVPSGGEPVTPELYDYVDTALDATINEIYGQTECNFLIGTNDRLMPENREATGKPCPGHTVDIIDPDTGDRLPDGEIGHIAVKQPDPSMLIDYWNDPERTTDLFVDDWMKTGDAGSRSEDGFIYFEGRADDVILTAGYRVSPLEVEQTLREHDAVNDAVVVGVDHGERGQIVKAFIQLAPRYEPSDDLTEAIQTRVRDQLAAYEYPRAIEYVDEFPTTVSGKIQRHKLTEP